MAPLNYASPYLQNAAYVAEGTFNIDQYIGDPRYMYRDEYRTISGSNLDLQAQQILSGSESYGIYDFVRLIKFFDNQLFKMIKDFTPARTTTTTGIIIKPHVLNRSKIKATSLEWSRPEYSGSIDTAFIQGTEGGTVTSSLDTTHTVTISTLSGSVQKVINNNSPEFNGELGGSVLTVTTQSLNPGNIYRKATYTDLNYSASIYTNFAEFNTGTLAQGEIKIYCYDDVINNPADLELEPPAEP
jgi:hypothetical protein